MIKYRYKLGSESGLREQPHPASAGIKCSKFVFRQSLELLCAVMYELINSGLWWS